MDESSKVYVGLDVHKETIAIARALSGREPARRMGEVAHDVGRLVKKLQPLGDPVMSATGRGSFMGDARTPPCRVPGASWREHGRWTSGHYGWLGLRTPQCATCASAPCSSISGSAPRPKRVAK